MLEAEQRIEREKVALLLESDQPLAEMTVREVTAPTEADFYLTSGGKLPAIVDDAYLNFISCPNGSLTGVPLFGDATFIWN